mmetsp:Transcript_27625/g.48001  ORF Transcript_27625/g.48001 Transcript_27625/m.48001 type:complete len:225 (-) Transcript_27625:1108-1782(-)
MRFVGVETTFSEKEATNNFLSVRVDAHSLSVLRDKNGTAAFLVHAELLALAHNVVGLLTDRPFCLDQIAVLFSAGRVGGRCSFRPLHSRSAGYQTKPARTVSAPTFELHLSEADVTGKDWLCKLSTELEIRHVVFNWPCAAQRSAISPITIPITPTACFETTSVITGASASVLVKSPVDDGSFFAPVLIFPCLVIVTIPRIVFIIRDLPNFATVNPAPLFVIKA